MKITVFGATGGIGQEIVRQGLAAGHGVTAVVRDPRRLTVKGEALSVFTVAALNDPEALREAVAGRDAVLSGLGASSRKEAGVAAPLTRTVLKAMELADVQRLLVVSAAPLGPVPEGESFLNGRIITPIVKGVFKDIYKDLGAMEEELALSGTDWSAVRPPKLVNKPMTGDYRTVVEGNPRNGIMIGRADVAHAMLAMIDDSSVFKHAVGVAY